MSWVGRIIGGRYRLMQVVGRGGHALVYRGVERGTGDDVAVKVLHEGLPDGAALEARMEREYRALDGLRGTAAPRAYGLHREGGALCLVMELLRGEDLDQYLGHIEGEGRKVELRTLVEFIQPVVSTLEIAHDRDIVHRDLKPGNIFILGRGGPGGVRLVDFGLAVEGRSSITGDGIVIGSPSYIAPEVWGGNPRALDHRVDVYSLGAIIYRALAGQIPFPVAGMKEKLDAATSAARPSLHALRPDLPPRVDAWVKQALAIDREARFARVGAMWNAFLASVRTRNTQGDHHGKSAS